MSMATPKKPARRAAMVVKSLAKKPVKGSAVKGGAMGGGDDLDDLEVERLKRK
jgi:hypothetical protein